MTSEHRLRARVSCTPLSCERMSQHVWEVFLDCGTKDVSSVPEEDCLYRLSPLTSYLSPPSFTSHHSRCPLTCVLVSQPSSSPSPLSSSYSSVLRHTHLRQPYINVIFCRSVYYAVYFLFYRELYFCCSKVGNRSFSRNSRVMLPPLPLVVEVVVAGAAA